jgi:hypothetical protein
MRRAFTVRDGLSTVAVMALLCTILPAGTVWTQDEPSGKNVVEVVEQFEAASKTKDLDAVMKAVAVPYHYGGDKIIRERGKLRAEMKAEIEAATGAGPAKHKVERVQRYKDFRPLVGDEGQLKRLDEAMGTDGWVVTLRVWEQGQAAPLSPDGAYPLTLLVRIQDGKAKVVGAYNYRGAAS